MRPEIKQKMEQIKNGQVPEGYISTKAGVLPKWGCVRMNQIAEPITDKAGDGVYETLSISAGIGFVNQAKKFGKELSGKQYEKYTVLKRGDFSYNKGNSKAYPQGCIYRLKDRKTAAVPNVFESFTIKEGNPDYYEQLFAFGFLNKQLSTKINHGVRDDGLLNLNEKDFYSCYLPAPPIVEQKKIAEILSVQDKIIELQQKKIDELQKYKKAMLQKMFPKKGENVPEIRFPGFTDTWELRKLSDFAIKAVDNRGKTPPISSEGTHPLIEVASLGNGFPDYTKVEKYLDDYSFKHNLRDYLKEGDILFSTVGSIGLVSLMDACENAVIAQNIVAFRAKEGFLPKYLYSLFSTAENQYRANRIVMGAVQPSIKVSQLVDVEYYVTINIKEQKLLGELFYNLNTLITLHQRRLEEYKTYKKSLMQLLLTGIVRVKI